MGGLLALFALHFDHAVLDRPTRSTGCLQIFHRNDIPLLPVSCQICGKPGHKERYCPNAREFLDFDLCVVISLLRIGG